LLETAPEVPLNNNRRGKKIQLNKETLKRLTAETMRGIGGAISVGTCSGCLETYCGYTCFGRCTDPSVYYPENCVRR
jgi:hypothetical protein